jgi:hypothetical protein
MRNLPTKKLFSKILTPGSTLTTISFRHFASWDRLRSIAHVVLSSAILLSFSSPLISQTYRTTGNSHDWNDPAAWTCQGGGCKGTPGNLLNGGVQVLITDSISYSGPEIKVMNANISISDEAKLIINGTNLLVENNKNKGSLYVAHGSLIVYGSFENRGIIEFSKAYVRSSGNFISINQITLDSACIEVENGDFENSGSILGNFGNIKVTRGNLIHTGTWSTGIAYCVSGTITGSLPGSPDCDAVTINCDCLREPCAIPNPDILPGHEETLGDIVSPGLISLADGQVNDSLKNDLFILNTTGKVVIDINFKDHDGTLSQVLSKYSYGPVIYDGYVSTIQSNVITLFFPIADLIDLDSTPAHKQYINSVTQTFPTQGGPIRNVEEQGSGSPSGGGTVSVTGSSLPNQGDFAQESFFARAGYNLTGAGINIGILSDSYDNGGLGSPSSDVQDGYLPNNVTVVNDLSPEIGIGIDEGRAMAQIVHSVAPGSDLYFHTGFEGPGKMAEAIIKLANDYNCQVITDDITHPGQPFFGVGVVGKAIEQVVSDGAHYFTSAGNFADRAWSAVYNDLGGFHNHGGGNTLQKVNLGTGAYLIILQWDDNFYSLTSDGPGGAQNDFDIFLADDQGRAIYNFSRNNLGDDPVEVLPFYVINNTSTNIVIRRKAGTGSPRLKYIVYKAGEKNQGFDLVDKSNYGKGTITGHATSPAAVTVGAVRYDNTPTFGGTLQTQAFSSRGDDATLGKPDFTAVNGGNISFDLGGGDYAGDADILPNFFGTSSSSPHAAAVAALLLDAQNQYSLTYDVVTAMKTRAIGYAEPPNVMGNGFLSAYNTLLGYANPSPSITQLDLTGFTGTPEEGGTLVIKGEFFVEGTTEVYFRDQQLTPTDVTDSTITVVIPPYSGGNPAIWVLNNAIADGDGGADTAYFSDPVITTIDIIANDTTKRFGEELPAFTFRTSPALSAFEMSLLEPYVAFFTNATALTDAESFPSVTPYLTIPEENLAPELTELYQFNFVPGNIYIAPMELKIIPKDFTVTYGSPVRDLIDYNLEFGTPQQPANISATNLATLKNGILQDYKSSQANDLLILTDISLSNISLSNISLSNFISLSNISLSNISLSNLLEGKSFITSFKTLKNISLSNISLSNISLSNISLSNSINSGAVPLDISLFEQNNQWDGGTEFGDTYSNISLSNISLSNISLSNFISLSNAAAGLAGQLNISLSNISLSNISLSNFISLSNISLSNISLSNISLSNFISLSNISEITNISLSNGDIVEDYNDATFRNFISLSNNDNTEILSIFEESEAQENYDSIIPLFPINFISGIGAGQQIVAPATFLSEQYSKNFIVTYGLGNADITQSSINIQTHDTTGVYGDSLPDFRITIDGLKYLDSLKNVLERIDLIHQSTGLPYDGSAGTYNIVPVINNDNYQVINTVIGTFTVTPRPATLTVADEVITYGDAEPAYMVTETGVLPGDVIYSGFTTDPAYTGNAGVYTINPVLTGNTNYNVTVVPGTLTVNPKAATIQVASFEITYGDAQPVYTATETGVLPGDVIYSGFILDPAYTGDVGVYTIYPDLSGNNNYNVSVSAGTLTVHRRAVTLTIDDKAIVIGDPLPVFTASVMTLASGDSNADIYSALFAPDYDGSTAGFYNIIPTLTGNPNYAVTVDPGTLYVNPLVGCNMKISASGLCKIPIDEMVTVDGVTYHLTTILRFEYTNPNSVPIYIPVGNDNNYKTKGQIYYTADPPTVFLPGTHSWEVKTTGEDLQWEVKTPGCNNFAKSPNGSNANPCPESAIGADIGLPNDGFNGENIDIQVYPNPFDQKFTLDLSEDLPNFDSEVTLELYDAIGRLLNVQVYEQIPGRRFEIDMNDMQSGIYLLRVRSSQENRIFKVLKR